MGCCEEIRSSSCHKPSGNGGRRASGPACRGQAARLRRCCHCCAGVRGPFVLHTLRLRCPRVQSWQAGWKGFQNFSQFFEKELKGGQAEMSLTLNLMCKAWLHSEGVRVQHQATHHHRCMNPSPIAHRIKHQEQAAVSIRACAEPLEHILKTWCGQRSSAASLSSLSCLYLFPSHLYRRSLAAWAGQPAVLGTAQSFSSNVVGSQPRTCRNEIFEELQKGEVMGVESEKCAEKGER